MIKKLDAPSNGNKEDPFGGIKPRDELQHPKDKTSEVPQEELKNTPQKNVVEEQVQEPYYQDYSRGRYSPSRRGRKSTRYYQKTFRGPGGKQSLSNEDYYYENQVFF